MPEPLASGLSELRSALLDEQLVRAVAAGRRRRERPSWRRVELRPVKLQSGPVLQITRYDETQGHIRNEAPGAASTAAVDALLGEPFGSWRVETAQQILQLRVTKRGEAQLHRQDRQAGSEAASSHDRPKARLLPLDDPLWHVLGLADEHGAIKPSRRRKHRQVENFLRLLAPVVDDAMASGRLPEPSAERPLQVVDLGCGNAYLSFAAFAYLSAVRRLPVRMTGVDVKEQVRERNTVIAGKLGWADMVRFAEGTIAGVVLEEQPDVVLALHACDTATDDALARAVRWQAPVVLVAPCCHHDLQGQLRHGVPPSPYGLLTSQPILRERFADAMTDAMRAAILRLLGYRVDVAEFVAVEQTPRNLLIRAVRTGARPPQNLRDDYARLTADWSAVPALHRLLVAELEEPFGN